MKLRSYIHISVGMLLSALLFSCSDDNAPSIPPEGNPDEGQINQELLDYQFVVNNLFVDHSEHTYIENLGEPSSTQNYTPRLGEQLDPAIPTVYSLGMEDEQDAWNYFITYLLPPGAESRLTDDGSAKTLDMGEYGSISYVIGGDVLASVKVNLPNLPTLTHLNFIDKNLWPNNESTLFIPGTIYSQIEGEGTIWKSVRYWLCVRGCESGHSAILITFNSGLYEEIEFIEEDQTNFTRNNFVRLETWNALAHLLKDEYETIYNVVNECYESSEYKQSSDGYYKLGLGCFKEAFKFVNESLKGNHESSKGIVPVGSLFLEKLYCNKCKTDRYKVSQVCIGYGMEYKKGVPSFKTQIEIWRQNTDHRNGKSNHMTLSWSDVLDFSMFDVYDREVGNSDFNDYAEFM